MARISPHFPLSHGVPRVDDRRVVSGIVYVIKNGLQWKDAPKGYGPHKTLYNRFLRWSRIGVFDRIFAALAGEGSQPERIMIDSTHLKAHRTAASLLKKGDVPRPIGRTKGGLNSKLHAVCDGEGQPLILLLSEGQMSDHKGARLMVDALPTAFSLLGDKGYDSNWFSKALADKASNHAFRRPKVSSSRSTTTSSPAPQDRKRVRQAQGLAAHRYPLRSRCPHLLLGNLHRRYRHLLALITES